MEDPRISSVRSGRARLSRTVLIGCGVLLVTLFASLSRYDATDGAVAVSGFLLRLGALFACYALGSWAVLRAPRARANFLLVFAGAVVMRIALLPAGLPPDHTAKRWLDDARDDLYGERVAFDRFLLYDDDLWRHLWDAHVWASGTNPFRHAPDAPQLDELAEPYATGEYLWQDIRDYVNHPDVPTIYPPAAQALGRLAHALAPGSVLAFKSLIVLLDLSVVLLIAATLRARGDDPAASVLYAWNPLVIKVFAGSAHIDVAMVAALALIAWAIQVGARRLAAVGFLAAIAFKLSPLVLAPIVARRIGVRTTAAALVVAMATYLPFALDGTAVLAGLRTFATDWRFNGGLFELLRWLGGDTAARGLSAGLFLAVAAVIYSRDARSPSSFAAAAAATLGALLVTSPTVMPWYVVWVLPFAVIARRWAWIALTLLICLAFTFAIDAVQRPWVLATEYGGLSALLLWEGRRRRQEER